MDQDRHSAEFLDFVYDAYTNDEVTQAEVDFIASQIEPSSKILDIGCGTGRHAIPLARRGFSVVALDNTRTMLERLAEKRDRDRLKIELRYADFLDCTEFDGEFDAAICFWNSFVQIASDPLKGRAFFRGAFRALRDGGRLILEISNPKSFDPDAFSHESTVERNGFIYEAKYRLTNYDRVAKTSVSSESIVVKKGGETVKRVSTEIVMRWWERDEISDLARGCGFKQIALYGDDYAAFAEPSESLLFAMTR